MHRVRQLQPLNNNCYIMSIPNLHNTAVLTAMQLMGSKIIIAIILINFNRDKPLYVDAVTASCSMVGYKESSAFKFIFMIRFSFSPLACELSIHICIPTVKRKPDCVEHIHSRRFFKGVFDITPALYIGFRLRSQLVICVTFDLMDRKESTTLGLASLGFHV